MGFCIDCPKCDRCYDTKYFPEFCPYCYTGIDDLGEYIVTLENKINSLQKRLDAIKEGGVR